MRAWSQRMLKRLPSSQYSTWTPSSCPITRWKRRVMAESMMLKSTGAKTQPCFTPTFTLKDSDWSSPVSTLACIPSCSCCRMLRNLGGTPSLERFFQSCSGVSRCMVGGRSGRLSRICGSAGLVWLKRLSKWQESRGGP